MKLSDEVGTLVHAFSDAGRKDSVRRLARRVEAIEDFAQSWADEPCQYDDNCPALGSRHGCCITCRARRALETP